MPPQNLNVYPVLDVTVDALLNNLERMSQRITSVVRRRRFVVIMTRSESLTPQTVVSTTTYIIRRIHMASRGVNKVILVGTWVKTRKSATCLTAAPLLTLLWQRLKVGVIKPPANRKRKRNGTVLCCSASWQKWRVNTCVKALRFISKAHCRPVNGPIRLALKNTPPKWLLTLAAPCRCSAVVPAAAHQQVAVRLQVARIHRAVGANLSSHKAATSSVVVSNPVLLHSRTRLLRKAMNHQWISTTISRSDGSPSGIHVRKTKSPEWGFLTSGDGVPPLTSRT